MGSEGRKSLPLGARWCRGSSGPHLHGRPGEGLLSYIAAGGAVVPVRSGIRLRIYHQSES
jgi:hypothetical protein